MDSGQALLQQYLDASESETEDHLGRLLNDYARPLISRIVGSKLRGFPDRTDAEDVVSETIARLLARLRELKRQPQQSPIHDLRGYIAAAAYHSCDERLRENRPWRVRLSNHLRYLLRHRSDLAMWNTPSGTLCGYRSWQSQAQRQIPPLTLHAADSVETLIKQIFVATGAPVEFDALVDAVGHASGLDTDHGTVPLERFAEEPSTASSPAEVRISLQELWQEVLRLPPRQRTALILNLRDRNGRELVSLLPLTGTASIREIADAVQIPPERFAELWSSIPLDDRTIGQLLGATREQVIKLRRLARERLWRRLQRNKTFS
jgi:RNA polymerase sigma factor (sigma-70 family)